MTQAQEYSPVQEAIAARLRAHMAERRLSQVDVAQALGIHKGTLNRYLSGSRDIPSSLMLLLAREIDIDMNDVYEAGLRGSEPRGASGSISA